jgi:hypothetical protein
MSKERTAGEMQAGGTQSCGLGETTPVLYSDPKFLKPSQEPPRKKSKKVVRCVGRPKREPQHDNNGVVICPVCGQRFNNLPSMRDHLISECGRGRAGRRVQ